MMRKRILAELDSCNKPGKTSCVYQLGPLSFSNNDCHDCVFDITNKKKNCNNNTTNCDIQQLLVSL